MKAKFFIPLLAFATLLSSCKKEYNNEDTPKTVTVSITQVPNAYNVTESTTQDDLLNNETAPTAVITEEKVSENIGDITVLDLAEICYGENYPECKENEELRCKDIVQISESVISVISYIYNTETYETDHSSKYLNFIDIEASALLAKIPVTGNYGKLEFYSHTEGFPAKYHLINITYEPYETTYATLTVNADYTYEITEGSKLDYIFDYYGHTLYESDYNIEDADRDFTAIVEGVAAQSDFDFYAERRLFGLAVDENSFVYKKTGYERVPGFGIYDFETDTATDVPDSNGLYPIGIYNGKIYSEHTEWDGFPDSLYVTDIETLETAVFLDDITVFSDDTAPFYNCTFYMSDNGENLIFVDCSPYGEQNSDGEITANEEQVTSIYKIDPVTSEYTLICTVPEETYDITSYWQFIGNDKIYTENDNTMVIIQL